MGLGTSGRSIKSVYYQSMPVGVPGRLFQFEMISESFQNQ